MRILGKAPLPDPVPATYDDLCSGRLHYQRVSVTGIVHSIELEEKNVSTISLAMGQRRLEIRYRPEKDTPRRRSLMPV